MNIQGQTIFFICVVLQHFTGILSEWNDGRNWNDVSVQMMDNILPGESSKRYLIHLRSVWYATQLHFQNYKYSENELIYITYFSMF